MKMKRQNQKTGNFCLTDKQNLQCPQLTKANILCNYWASHIMLLWNPECF